MDGGAGLTNGRKVAIIGGGVSGTGLALALLQFARGRGRTLDVQLFESGRMAEGGAIAPAILSPECRTRLAGLGCRISPGWHVMEISAIEVISGSAWERLRPHSSKPWVVDGWPHGPPGQQALAAELAGAARALGARRVPRRVSHVVHAEPDSPGAGRPVNAGALVVRARGGAERFHAVALAGGASHALGDRFFPGFSGPPSLPAVQARLRLPALRPPDPIIRILLSPLPGVDMLYLIPCPHSLYALALGPTAAPEDLCQALMEATRDGYAPDGLEISHLSVTRVPFGAGRRLTARGRLAVGAAAFGHPLQLGISETLASASRAAAALFESAGNEHELRRRYVRDGLWAMLRDASAGVKAVRWLRRAGGRAARVFAAARTRGGALPFSGGVLGLSSPSPLALLMTARRAGVLESLSALVRPAFDPLPPSVLRVEPDLYYVVDDDTDAREALTHLLESQGAKVIAFADELALFSAVARRPPTAILLDVVLNRVDGIRLCEGLLAHPLTRGARVLVMSALDRPHIRERALAAGAEAFLAKPIDPEQLLALLRRHREQASPAAPEEPRSAGVKSGRYAS